MAIPTQMAPGWAPFAQGEQLGFNMRQQKFQNKRQYEQFQLESFLKRLKASQESELHPYNLEKLINEIKGQKLTNDPAAQIDFMKELQRLSSGGNAPASNNNAPHSDNGKFDFDVEAAGDQPPVNGQSMSPPSPDELRGIPAVDQMMNSNNIDAQSSNPAIRKALEHFNQLKNKYMEMRNNGSQQGNAGGMPNQNINDQQLYQGDQGLSPNQMMAAGIKKTFGSDINAENPNQKRELDLKSKIAFERAQQANKIDLEKIKNENRQQLEGIKQQAASHLEDQKQEGRITVAQAKDGIKYAGEAQTAAVEDTSLLKDINEARAIMQRNPSATGRLTSKINAILPNEDTKLLNSIFEKMRAKLAHVEASRPGAQVLSMVGGAKPSVDNTVEENLALLNHAKEGVQLDASERRKQYFSRTGKHFDYNYGGQLGTVHLTKGGKVFEIPVKDVEKAYSKGYTYAD